MSHIANLKRDMFWAGIPTVLAAGSAFSFGAEDASVGTDGVDYPKQGSFQLSSSSSIGTGDLRAAGIAISRTEVEENLPFRVKMFSSVDAFFGVGFTDTVAATTATDKVRWLGVGKTLDEVACIAPPADVDPRASAIFFVAVPGGTADFILGGSVQKLIAQPDQFASVLY
jgi:hypothetical protein